MTLEKFLPSSFDTKSTQGNVEASCFNADKEQTMKVPPTAKEGTTSESSPKVSPGEEEKKQGKSQKCCLFHLLKNLLNFLPKKHMSVILKSLLHITIIYL